MDSGLKYADGSYKIDEDTPLTAAEKFSTGYELARWLIDHGYVDELSLTEMTLTREMNSWLTENVNV